MWWRLSLITDNILISAELEELHYLHFMFLHNYVNKFVHLFYSRLNFIWRPPSVPPSSASCTFNISNPFYCRLMWSFNRGVLHYRHGCLSSRMNQRIRFVAIWRAWENPRFTSHWHGCRWYLWWFRSSSCCWWWDSAGTFLILWEFLHTGHKIDTSPSYTTTSSSSIRLPIDRWIDSEQIDGISSSSTTAQDDDDDGQAARYK